MMIKNMINKQYFAGYEGEGQVKIWIGELDEGLIIWEGYFETILEGCFFSDYLEGGLLECYCNRGGFYDEIWEIVSNNIVIDELSRFDEKKLSTSDEEIIRISKEVIETILKLIHKAIGCQKSVYIEYL